jgi:hypothetical protein
LAVEKIFVLDISALSYLKTIICASFLLVYFFYEYKGYVKKFINWQFCALLMKKSVIQTNAGLYSIYFPNGDSGTVEVYRGRNQIGGQIGDLLLGSLERLPDSGLESDNGEYVVTAQKTDEYVRQEAFKHETMQSWNYIVMRELNGKLRILPQTRNVESGLTKRLKAVESSQKASKQP